MHEKHRQRMKNKFIEHGEKTFFPHELLEILLFFSIPRVNTNDKAHALIDRFGSINGVLSADVKELTSVNGVGTNSAILIKTCDALCRLAKQEKQEPKIKLNTYLLVKNYLIKLFSSITDERLYIIMLDNSMRVIDTKCVMKGTVSASTMNTSDIVRMAVKTNAASVILAHNHPKGIAVPSASDIEATYNVNKILRLVDVELIDHFVLTNNRCTSIIHKAEDLNS